MSKPIDTAVFTTKFVLEEKKTITVVMHEAEDGAWQFFSSDHYTDFEKVAKIVGFQELIDIDPTLRELTDMKMGEIATRKNKKDKWTIKNM